MNLIVRRNGAALTADKMDRERALQLLKGGYDSVQRWNRWRSKHSELPNLSHTDFTDVDLTDANFCDANLGKSNFLRARLVGAIFTNATLTGVSFRYANLNQAKLGSVKLIQVSFKGANLCGADFRRAIFKNVVFEFAECDVQTKWPDGFEPASAGLTPWPE